MSSLGLRKDVSSVSEFSVRITFIALQVNEVLAASVWETAVTAGVHASTLQQETGTGLPCFAFGRSPPQLTKNRQKS